MSDHEMDKVLLDIRPVLETFEKKISRKYEKQIAKLQKENENLVRMVNENKDYSYQALNERYVKMVNDYNEQIAGYKSTIAKLNQRSSPQMNKSTSQHHQQQQDILSLIKPVKELPKNPEITVKQEDPDSVFVSSPVANEGLSPTQYSSSQIGSDQLTQQQQQPQPVRPLDNVNTRPPVEQHNSYSIFHNNIDMDFDDDDSDSGYHDDDSPLSQRKRIIIEDSQKDYEVLVPVTKKNKRVPLRDITNVGKNNITSTRITTRGDANKLNFNKISKVYNLSRNFINDRDWIIEDFKPNPILIDANDGLYTKKRFILDQQQQQQDAGNGRCKCANCLKFFQVSGQPIELSGNDRFNNLIFKFHHRKNGDGNLFNFTIDAPGLNQSEFPNSQESKDFKLKAKRINKLKALIRLMNSMELDQSSNKQCGLYVFKNDIFNDAVIKGNFIIDDWVYDELEKFVQDREAGLI